MRVGIQFWTQNSNLCMTCTKNAVEKGCKQSLTETALKVKNSILKLIELAGPVKIKGPIANMTERNILQLAEASIAALKAEATYLNVCKTDTEIDDYIDNPEDQFSKQLASVKKAVRNLERVSHSTGLNISITR
jgi:hypothetical protein